MMDHFERLGLPRRFAIDPADLEREYLARSRALHPDYHQLSSAADRAASVALSAALNEAYTVLRDPFRRADYILGLLGGPSAAEQNDMPPEFLEEMLELRMEIAELQPGTPRASELETQLAARRDALLDRVGSILDQPETPGNRERLVEARRLLNAARYLGNLLRDLRAL